MLAIARTRLGQQSEARRAIAALEARQKAGQLPAAFMALLRIELGDKETALRWLGKAIDERGVQLLHLKTGEEWDPLRSDPRFAALLRRMRFPGAGRE
jgi:hypothetical protein